MTQSAGSNPISRPGKVRRYLWIAGRLGLGYIVAVGAGSILFALLLQFQPDADNPQLLDRSATAAQLAVACFVLGGIFGLPYTVLGSLGFWFLLPRRAYIFLIIGTFCPVGALFTLSLAAGGTLNWETSVTLLSLPPGLIAAYLYGAIGFGQGFHRWRFA